MHLQQIASTASVEKMTRQRYKMLADGRHPREFDDAKSYALVDRTPLAQVR
jgi:hypothetical protein